MKTSIDRTEIRKQNEIENEEIEYQKDKSGLRDRKLPKKFEDYDMNFMAALATGSLPSENPATYVEAIKEEDWKRAIEQEINMLRKN